MMTRIRITWPHGEAMAALDDTPTTRKLLETLPCVSSARIWSHELYFSVPVKTALEPDARQVVAPGTVCFWVGGGSLAIALGHGSFGERCHLVSKGNILGVLESDPKLLKSVHDGERITLQQA